MEKIRELLKNIEIKEELVKVIMTNSMDKDEKYFKIVIEGIKNKNMSYQISYYYEKKVKHENIEKGISEKIIKILSKGYKQCDIKTLTKDIKILTNKKGKVTVIEKKKRDSNMEQKQSHNKVKNYILKEGDKIDFLKELGIVDNKYKVYPSKQKKFKQINKFLEMLKATEKEVSEGGNIIDIGSGKSYLTFATYFYFNKIKNKKVKIIGIDIKKDVIEHCEEIRKKLKYENLEFINIDIRDFKSEQKIDMCITLHACNTATDYAIYSSINWDAKVILSVPCCHQEVLSQLKNVEGLEFILKHGVVKDKFATLLTDSIRSLILESKGYKSDIIEFIDENNTPKNMMIKAVKNKKNNIDSIERYKEELEETINQFKIEPMLYKLVKNNNS